MSTEQTDSNAAPARTRGLYFHLWMLALATLLPVLVVGGIAVSLAAREFRDYSQQRLEETAGVLAQGVELGIEHRISQLRVHAHSDGASQILGGDDDTPLRVFRESQAVDHGVPAALLQRARSSGKAQISDLILSDDGSVPKVAIAAPVSTTTDGQHDVLTAILPSNELITTIARSAGKESMLVAVVDSQGRIAARSRDPERFVGQPAPDWDALQQVPGNAGLFHAVTKEGSTVVFAFQRLHTAPGWALVIGEPRRSLEARWQRPLAGIGLGGLLAALIALMVARFLSGRILSPLRSLARRGQHIVQANATDPTQMGTVPIESSITEFRQLEQSMSDAVVALRERADNARRLTEELTESERRYRAIAEAGAMVLWEAAPSGQVQNATGWNELTGQSNESALGNGWLKRAHEEDLPALELAVQQGISSGNPLDIEFRILDHEQQWRWVRARGGQLRSGDRSLIKWVGVLEDVHARRQAQARIAYMAQHDVLTGLPNRSLLLERLEQAMAASRRGQNAALLLLDLDRFKEVNDTLGHPVGDRLLCDVSKRMSACLRPTDTIARMGGDEFAILLGHDSATPEITSTLADRLQETVSKPLLLEGHKVTVGASIGIALIDGMSISGDQTMRNADLALYRAKEEGRGRYCFFEADMDTRMQRRRRQELELRNAMDQRQFQLHYQPLVDLQTHRIKGFEAMLRWNHPSDGLLDASQFSALAEEIGLMAPLCEWMLQTACRDASSWPEHLKVAVNLSVSMLSRADLIETVERILRTTHLPPHRLELEVTENALLANIGLASARLLPLKASGVSIVMDGFGTGYSSLGYLRAFPFDKVKIDRSFIRELGQQREGGAIISAITHLCERLGITATAEGVESESQLSLLRREQCGEGQGLIFGGPIPSEQIEALLREWPHSSGK